MTAVWRLANSRWPLGAFTASVGTAMLLLRPPGSSAAVLMTMLAGILGRLTPLPDDGKEQRGLTAWAIALGFGLAAILAAGMLWDGVPAQPVWAPLVLASLLAAFAEEVFFRRLVYGLLIPWGAPIAIAGAALAFAAIHVPVYGILTVPINLTIGLLLGWQRWMTGNWTAPALTHAVANLVQFV